MALVVVAVLFCVLSLAVWSLYEKVLRLEAAAASDGSGWPLGNAHPGHAMPTASGIAEDFTGIVVVSSDHASAFAAWISAVTVADAWDLPALLLVRRMEHAAWLRELDDHQRERCAELDRESFEALKPRTLPVAIFVKAGRIVEALASPTSPGQVEQAFRLVAAPQLLAITNT